MYEASHPLSLECESLQQQIEALTHDLHTREEEVAIFRKVNCKVGKRDKHCVVLYIMFKENFHDRDCVLFLWLKQPRKLKMSAWGGQKWNRGHKGCQFNWKSCNPKSIKGTIRSQILIKLGGDEANNGFYSQDIFLFSQLFFSCDKVTSNIQLCRRGLLR